MAIQQGWSQMTAAATNTIRRAIGGAARRTVRRAVKRASGGRVRVGSKKKARAARRARPARLVKGSAAARRYMAKIRALRKK